MDNEYITRVKLDYADQFVKVQDEFDWDLACARNRYCIATRYCRSPEEFARVYVEEYKLPFVYAAVVAKEIRKHLVGVKCRIYSEIQRTMKASSLAQTATEFYGVKTLKRKFPEVKEHWDSLFVGPLAEQLGPLGPFKYETGRMQDRVPLCLLKGKVEKKASKPAEQEGEENEAESVPSRGTSGEERAQQRSAGLNIIFDTEIQQAEVMSNEEVKTRYGAGKAMGRRADKSRRKTRLRRKQVQQMSESVTSNNSGGSFETGATGNSPKNTVIKIDMRQLQTDCDAAQ